MISLSRIKQYLVSKGMESVLPMLSSHSPATLIAAMDKLRQVGIERMRVQHRGTPEELELRLDAANSFFEMAKRKLPHLSSATQKKLVHNMYLNALNIGDQKRDEYFEKHGEYPPFFLLISPSMACDLRCFGCYAWKHPKDKNLSFEKMDEIITEAKEDMGIYFISLTGGEPTIWKPLEKLIQKHDDVFFQMYTHGMNIDDAMAKRFSEYGNIYPAISIEGSEEFTDARRGEGAYKKILTAMDNLNRHGCLFGFSITHTSINHESVISGDFMDTLINHGAAFGWYFQYIPIGRDPEMSLVPTPQQRLERREVCKNIRKEKPVLVYDFWNDGDACEGCLAWGRRYIHITAQGLVEPCVFVHFAKDSVHDKSLGEILRGDCFRYMRGRQPFTTDLRAPCPQIDHPEELKNVVEKFGMVPTHEGAEKIVTDHHETICKNAIAWKQCLADYDESCKGSCGSCGTCGHAAQEATETAGD